MRRARVSEAPRAIEYARVIFLLTNTESCDRLSFCLVGVSSYHLVLGQPPEKVSVNKAKQEVH